MPDVGLEAFLQIQGDPSGGVATALIPFVKGLFMRTTMLIILTVMIASLLSIPLLQAQGGGL